VAGTAAGGVVGTAGGGVAATCGDESVPGAGTATTGADDAASRSDTSAPDAGAFSGAIAASDVPTVPVGEPGPAGTSGPASERASGVETVSRRTEADTTVSSVRISGALSRGMLKLSRSFARSPPYRATATYPRMIS